MTLLGVLRRILQAMTPTSDRYQESTDVEGAEERARLTQRLDEVERRLKADSRWYRQN